MSNFKAECRKFQPNIFNKIKCSNCFRQREEHTAEALESNRATRKVSKCGYLFVAPDWDFSIPLNRTKRWQRRWFVLYDDGELSYSVDDLPATIPQRVIDMNRVLEVSEAEDITGNQFALAITSPDRATFVKGTCREESRWWHDVLSVFPRSQKQHGRYKRNATFPGIKSSSNVLQQSRAALARTPSPALVGTFEASGARLRFHSCTSESLSLGRPSSAPTLEIEEDVFLIKNPFPKSHSQQKLPSSSSLSSPSSSTTAATPSASIPTPLYHSTPHSSLPPSSRLIRDEHKENTPPYSQDYHDHPPTSESPPTQDKVLGHRPRTRRTAKREARGLTHPRNDMSHHKLILSDLDDPKRGEKLKDIADSITRGARTNATSIPGKESVDKPTREKDAHIATPPTDATAAACDDLSSSDNTNTTTDSSLSDHVRGDPDGCGLEVDSPPSPPASDTQRVDLPAEDLLYIKKGWLLKQGHGQELNKYWFVLQGSSLRFYRDPTAEDNGILDGIIDLGMAKNVEECEVARNYGFRIIMWEEKKCVFSAVTSGIRGNWMQALRNAANLKEPDTRPALTLGEKIEREIVANREKTKTLNGSSDFESEALRASKSLLLSSDEDFKTASESLLNNDFSYEAFDPTGKDRSRSSARSRSTKRSCSSPPSSRRATRDDFPLAAVDHHVACFSEAESLHSIGDLGKQELPEKDSTGTIGSSSGETMLVDLLETQVESLKAKLEQTQVDELQRRLQNQEKENIDKSNIIIKLETLRKQFQEERQDMLSRISLEERKSEESSLAFNQQEELARRLSRSLQESELKIVHLSEEITSHSSCNGMDHCKTRTGSVEVNKQVSQLTTEVNRLKDFLKTEKSETYKWKDLVKELRSLLDGRNGDMDKKREEIEDLRETLKSTQSELDQTADRLYRGIEENEILCGRLRELERQVSQEKVRRGSSTLSISSSRERFSSRRNLPRMNSLSDLTNFDMNIQPEDLDRETLIEEYTDLRLRFEKAVNEVRAFKREVREAQALQDDLELSNQRFKNEIQAKEEDNSSELGLLSARIQDLTSKLSNSEKQVRIMKQKMTRTESRERRRTHSLKGRESFSLSKDMETKLTELESKVQGLLHDGNQTIHEAMESNAKSTKVAKRSKSFEESTKASRLRRKSLDGQSTNADAVKAIVRINELDAKICGLSGDGTAVTTSSSTSSSSNTLNSNPCSALAAVVSNTSNARSRSPTHPGSPLRSPLRSPSSLRKTLRSPRATPEKLVKVSRTDSEAKVLRERLSVNEKVFTTLQTKLSECSTWVETCECSCTCRSPSFSRLRERLNACLRTLQTRFQGRGDQCAAVNKLQPLSLRLHELLKDKLTQLLQRRSHLKAAGKWTRDAQLKDFAERLAFETLLLSQLGQAFQWAHKPESFEASVKLQELIEAHRKLSFLEKKLTNPEFDMDPATPLEFYTSLLAEKLVVEGDVINSMANFRSQKTNLTKVNETCKDLQKKVLERERTLANIVTQYKEGKLHEIAVVMAKETITGTQPPHDDNVLLEELRLREAWTVAQELLSQELVNLEASQSILRLAGLFNADPSTSMTLTTQPNVMASDRLHTGAEESLRQEMEESVFTLSSKYEEVLAQYRSGNTGIINSVSATMDAVLNEFAAVIAQKALIDGQLAVATGDDALLSTASEPLAIVEESRDPLESATDVVASESHLLMFLGGGDSSVESLVHSAMNQAEFSFLYNKLGGQCVSDLSSALSGGVKRDYSAQVSSSAQGSLKSINSSASASDRDLDCESVTVGVGAKIPPSPKIKKKTDVNRKSRRVSDITGMLNKCRQCEELRQEMNRLRRSLESKRLKRQEGECKKCLDYVKTIKNLEVSHREETDRLRDQVRYDPPTRDSDDELTELKRRLCLLEEGYESQISTLKKQYDDALGSQADGGGGEEKVRQRYQLEIEHLRGLCEKGLAAMETSHRRTVMQLEEEHRRELKTLQSEKEEALAEETQATLAALDAMRKAHEAEVQREVAKFKEEFLRRTENGHDVGEVHRRHEEEMAGIRKEILDLSEKYSIKCLESASLEEKLKTASKKLTESNRHEGELEMRNRQLKSHLSAQMTQMQSSSNKDLNARLKLKDGQLILKDEEIARLNQMLQKAQMTNIAGDLLVVGP